MQIDLSYWASVEPTGVVRFIVSTARNPAIVVAMEEFLPPHINPRDVSIFVPTPQVHLVNIYEAPTVEDVGVLTASYVVTPSFSAPRITPPLEIVVGGGREGRDPVDGANGVDIPDYDIPISWVEQKGSGPLSKLDDIPDDLLAEWTTRPGGGIDLLNGKVFNEGERYWLFFEPYLDSGISASIFDLTALIEAHIEDTDNPHAVTKTQVGLSNIPNAKSDAINLDDSNTLATSKAVDDLRESIVNKVIGQNRANLGVIPGSSDQLKPVVHGYNFPYDYMVIGVLRGIGANWNADNDTFAVVRDLTDTGFNVSLRNMSGAAATLFFDYILIKV